MIDTGSEKGIPGNQENVPVFEPDLQTLLDQACVMNASDIHIDPQGDGFHIRFRVDGAIQHYDVKDASTGHELLNLVKVSSGFTPDRARGAMEGHILFRKSDEDRGREMRVTIAPTVKGESVHLRLLHAPAEILKPDELGLSTASLHAVRDAVSRDEGVVLITGHTGAGKTMTLYSLVNELNRDLRQVCSIEDPVEYELNGVRQLQVDPSSGFYMPEGMRTLLRMDPDVIVVGEVRDTESAVTAVRAGVSGRLVTCTIHARNCAMAVDMLQYYQVPAKLLGNTLRLIVAQDLIRVLCSECAGERDVRRQDALLFEKYDIEPPKKLRTPEGCQACHGFGYRGRRGVFQVVPVDSELAQKIGDGVRGLELEELIGGKSIQTLEGSALQLARQGITTLEESIKVLP